MALHFVQSLQASSSEFKCCKAFGYVRWNSAPKCKSCFWGGNFSNNHFSAHFNHAAQWPVTYAFVRIFRKCRHKKVLSVQKVDQLSIFIMEQRWTFESSVLLRAAWETVLINYSSYSNESNIPFLRIRASLETNVNCLLIITKVGYDLPLKYYLKIHAFNYLGNAFFGGE